MHSPFLKKGNTQNTCSLGIYRLGREELLEMGRAAVWGGGALALAIRFLLAFMGSASVLGHRVEIVSPVTSVTRLAEGHWLKNLGLSPYAGSAYHASPLLLSILGPLVGNRLKDICNFLRTLLCVLFVIADLVGAVLLMSMGQILERAHFRHMSQLGLSTQSDEKALNEAETLKVGDVAFLTYLLNPFTIAVCVGSSTSPIENLMTILALYGATAGNVPLAGFGWAMATHLGLYPGILFIPIAYVLSNGPDSPPSKLFAVPRLIQATGDEDTAHGGEGKQLWTQSTTQTQARDSSSRKWLVVLKLVLWSAISWLCILGLCRTALHGHASIFDMWSETYKFIFTVEDLSPNLGLFWYFFTEVFDFFRPFFLMVFHANILFMIAPLTIRLNHRPIFLAFILTAISSMLKSYPTVGDAALYLGLMSLCTLELSDLQYSYVLLNGYILVSILGPVMYNLWIWRGTGNANFYFAINLLYAMLQTVLIVESVSTVIRYDRNLKKQLQHRNTKKAS